MPQNFIGGCWGGGWCGLSHSAGSGTGCAKGLVATFFPSSTLAGDLSSTDSASSTNAGYSKEGSQFSCTKVLRSGLLRSHHRVSSNVLHRQGTGPSLLIAVGGIQGQTESALLLSGPRGWLIFAKDHRVSSSVFLRQGAEPALSCTNAAVG